MLIQTYDRLGVLLDAKTGRPKMEPPFDSPGLLHAYALTDELEDALKTAPDHVRGNLVKGRDGGKFQPRASMQAWEETLYAPLNDGAAVVTPANETTMVPIFTLPANYLYPGRLLKWTVMGRQSSAITTPGTFTFRLAYSATGLGAVAVAASGAFAPNTVAAAANLTFMIEWWLVCRSSGTAGTAMGIGRIEWSDYNDATTATLKANLDMRMAPVAAPATVAIDTTVARALNPTYQPSLTTASMTAHMAILEALT